PPLATLFAIFTLMSSPFCRTCTSLTTSVMASMASAQMPSPKSSDELDAELLELVLGREGIKGIAEGSRAHVDNYILHIALFHDALEHLPEDWPLLNALCRVAGLQVHMSKSPRQAHQRLKQRFGALLND